MSVAQLERPDGKAGLAPEVQRLVFYAVDWRSYEKFLEAVGGCPATLSLYDHR